MDLQPGAHVGPYVVEAHLGSGGVAEVVRAKDAAGRTVALKVLRVVTPGLVARFRREAALQQSFAHPNVVGLHGLFEVDDVPVLVMQHVRGFGLDRLLATLTPTLAQVDTLAVGILDGLAAAHAAGLIHRDIKPANILLAVAGDDEIVPRIADFGIARSLGDEPRLTRTGQALGTPAYMAPEQIANAGAVDRRADLFSVGATLYEALAGVRAFPGVDPVSIWLAISGGKRVPLVEHRPDLPARVLAAVEGALATDPDARIATAEALRATWLGDHVPGRAVWPAGLASLVEAGARSDVPTWVTAVEPPNNLPADDDPFVGRRDELATLGARVGRERLLTLVGPGGVGKSRLSREAARMTLANWPGGVWWCDLADAWDADDVCRAVASALGERLGEGTAPGEIAALVGRRGRALLVLDNFEQVAEVAAQTVGRWLEEAPDSAFLVTSRVPLRVAGEHVLPIEPLPTHEDGAGPEGARATDAFALFVARARAADPRFSVGDGDAVAGIVRALEGFPLAIELAAARVRLLPPAKLLPRLSEHLDLLRARGDSGAHRQATLRGTLAWSWQLLQPPERLALAQLSVFRGAFRVEEAEAALDLSAWPDVRPLDVLEALVDHSLARRVTRADGEQALTLYVAVAAYAAEQLARPGAVEVDGASCTGPDGRAAMEARHVRAYCWRAEQLCSAMGQSRSWLPELPNLRIAADRAEASGDLTSTASLAYAVGRTLSRVGPAAEAIRQLERALRVSGVREDIRCNAIYWLAAAHQNAGRGDLAIALFQSNIDHARRAGSAAALAQALDGLATALHELGRVEECLSLYQQARTLWVEAGDARRGALTLGHIAMAEHYLGRLDDALGHFEDAVDKLRSADDMLFAHTLSNLGHLFVSRFDLPRAIASFEEANEVYRAHGDDGRRTATSLNLASALAHSGRTAEALDLLERVIRDSRQQGNQIILFYATVSVAWVRAASPLSRRVVAEAQRLGAGLGPYVAAVAELVRGEVLRHEGALEAALACAEAAVTAAESLKQAALVADAATSAAWSCLGLGRPDEAATWLERIRGEGEKERLAKLAAWVHVRVARGELDLAAGAMEALAEGLAPRGLLPSAPLVVAASEARALLDRASAGRG